MRTTINLAEDAFIAARSVAQRNRLSLGEAVSELIRQGVAAGSLDQTQALAQPLSRRFSLFPFRGDELITTQHVRELMEREGI